MYAPSVMVIQTRRKCVLQNGQAIIQTHVRVPRVCFGAARWHIFKPKNTYLGKFWRPLQCKMLVYFMGIWFYFTAIICILWPFGRFYGYLVHFGMLYREKSGNPGLFAHVVCESVFSSEFATHGKWELIWRYLPTYMDAGSYAGGFAILCHRGRRGSRVTAANYIRKAAL
jgi:hypothetical protein